ncbi:MAG: glycosyltransferase involved in cell wall biosynthesis [Patiriisocius sp.]|jgi:glycosyltransferase involved in cell wall biosynthesis
MDKYCFVQLYHISERGGGAEVQASYLSLELARRGYEVHYICQTINSEKENTNSNIEGVNIHWLPLRETLFKSTFNQIEELLVYLSPSIIIERMSSSFGLPIIRAKRKIEAKYVWICTDNDSPNIFRSTNKNFSKLPFLKFLFILRKSIRIDAIRWYVNRKADIIFSQNDIQELLIQKNFRRKSYRMISGHPFSKIRISSDDRFKKKIVLWCGNLGQHKRPELFIQLAKVMRSSKIEFLMVGGHSDTNYTSKIFTNKPDNLKNTGQLSFNESLEYFDNTTLLINTSISEGFSNTYIQAWLRGVPTLVFGSNPNKVITKNNLGYDVSSVDEAKQIVNELFSNYELYNQLSNNSYHYGVQNHSIKTMTDAFLSVINEK